MNGCHREMLDLVASAVKAPSGDNLQPWRFVLDGETRRIELELDATKDSSPMNAGQRMSRIACGAALENMVRAAERNGWCLELENQGAERACVRLEDTAGRNHVADPVMDARASNRRFYEGGTVLAPTRVELLEASLPLAGLRTHWVFDRATVQAWAGIEGACFARMYGNASMRDAILGNVRWNVGPGQKNPEGLSPASLELNAVQKTAMKMMVGKPTWLLKAGGSLMAMSAFVKKLVRSCSGFCVVEAPDEDADTDWLIGRCAQRAWLALTEAGLAAQPMMTLPVLENALCSGSEELKQVLDAGRIEALSSHFQALLPEWRGGRVGFVLRFGFAPPPTGRSGRLPLGKVIAWRGAKPVEAQETLVA